ASSQADALNTYLRSGIQKTLRTLTHQPGVRSTTPSTCAQSLRGIAKLAPHTRLEIVTVDGKVVCSSQASQIAVASSWLRAVATNSTSHPGVVPAMDGTGAGDIVLGASFRAHGQQMILLLTTPGQGTLLDPTTAPLDVMVVDRRTGLVLDHHTGTASHGATGADRPLAAALLVPGGSQTGTGVDGVRRIYSTSAVMGTDWVVLAGVSHKTAYATAYKDLYRNLAILGLFVIALFALGFVVHRRIVRPTRQLRDAMRRLSDTNLEVGTLPYDVGRVPESGPRELAQLGAAFNQMADARVRSEARFASLVRHGSDLVFVVGADDRLSYVTPSVQALLGATTADLMGAVFQELVHPDDRPVLRAELDRARSRPASVSSSRFEFRLAVGPHCREVEARVQNLLTDPTVNGIVVTCHDITDRKHAEQQLAHAAMHDALTGLPNRALVLDRLENLLARAGRTGATEAVLFLDLDRFKLINDSSGHTVGDKLLIQVANRLQAVTRPGDTLGRFGGDEFVLLCESLEGPTSALGVADRILGAMQAPFRLGGQDVYVTASIGIAFAQPGDEAGNVLRDADAALYRAKEGGRAGYAVFDDGMRAQVRKKLQIDSRLRQAIDGSGLFLLYQPVVSVAGGEPVGVEALLRCRDANRVMPPGDFIPVAEETGLIVPIGEWVLREACRQLASWQQDQRVGAKTHVAVNVSARQLTKPSFVEAVNAALADSGLDPHCLTLEITESVVMRDFETSSATIGELRSLGVSISIDDFGTGYSSLGYLERLPVDELKIDRSFVAPLGHRGRATAIVSSVVRLAHAVGLSVVAEGIEEPEQVALLKDMGCDFAQGFHFARPLEPNDALEYLLRGRPAVPRQRAAETPSLVTSRYSAGAQRPVIG
ncbi:MAG TPA: EAL domain-containing protein, partial [Mycobacteriales bacterium]|nr:EAL domain-containing protein [Mycobacteriales bacterium]